LPGSGLRTQVSWKQAQIRKTRANWIQQIV
jgi:hypothetical protein